MAHIVRACLKIKHILCAWRRGVRRTKRSSKRYLCFALLNVCIGALVIGRKAVILLCKR